MLLRIFRINDPYRLLGLLFLLILFSLPLLIDPAAATLQELKSFVLGEAIGSGKLMYAQVCDSTAPMTAGVFGILDWVFGRSLLARHILALCLIFFQAAFFGILLIQNKAYNDSTYVPALVFGLLCLFSFDMLSFSPELLASTVLLLALNNLFKEIEFRIERDETILNLGVYLGAATLLIFSYIIFLFGTILILFLFTRLNLRKFLLLLYGFVLPHALLVLLYFVWGETGALWHYYYQPNLTFHREMLIGLGGVLVLAAVPFVYFIFSLFMLNRQARFTKYQSQLFQVMFQWMLFCVLQLLITREFTPHSLVIFIPSLAYFISHYLLLIRRRWIAETMLWGFLVGILLMNFLSRRGSIDRVDYRGLFPVESTAYEHLRNERVMVLAPEWTPYQHNKMSGFFLDWTLSKEIFEQPDYYDHVMLVFQSLERDPPDTIIDPNDFMKGYFERMPQLQTQYKREGVYYKRQKQVSAGR